MKTAIFLILFLIGAGLFTFGLLWPTMHPATAVWTDAKANRLAEINGRLVELAEDFAKPISMYGGEDRGVLQAELLGLIKEKEELVATFESAIDTSQTPALYLRVGGILCVALGVALWCAIRLHELQSQPTSELEDA